MESDVATAEHGDRLTGGAVVGLDRFGDGAEEALSRLLTLAGLDQDHVVALSNPGSLALPCTQVETLSLGAG